MKGWLMVPSTRLSVLVCSTCFLRTMLGFERICDDGTRVSGREDETHTFIAYSLPSVFFLTSFTLPNEPLPMTRMNSKSSTPTWDQGRRPTGQERQRDDGKSDTFGCCLAVRIFSSRERNLEIFPSAKTEASTDKRVEPLSVRKGGLLAP
jgi:hypothetical protein